MPDQNIDPNDADFIDTLQNLLGIDPKKLDLLIPKLNPNVLTDLAGAVTNNDKKLAMQLILQGREQKMPNVSEDKIVSKNNKSKTKLLDMNMRDYFQFNVGDKVKVDGEDATVKLPSRPGNTVGVMIGGKMNMVDRKDVKRVEESVLGLANIPDIKRMQELAGIAPSGMADMGDQNPSIEIQAIDNLGNSIYPEEETVIGNGSTDCCGQDALSLLDELSEMLPNLRLSDVSSIRKRMNDILMKMNESVTPTVRKRKI